MIKNKILCEILLLMLVAVISCDKGDDIFNLSLQMDEPLQLASGLAVFDYNYNRVLHLDVLKQDIHVNEVFRLQEGETMVSRHVSSVNGLEDMMFIQTMPIDNRQSEIGKSLVKLNVPTGNHVQYSLLNNYGTMAFSPVGDRLVLYHGGNNESFQSDLFNPNETAIVNIAAGSSADNPRSYSVDLDGAVLRGVQFLKPLEVAGVSRELAAFYGDGVIRLLDMETPEGTVLIKLKRDDDNREIVPQKIIVRPGDQIRPPMIFVLARGSEDIFVISLVPPSLEQTEFWATLNQFEGGPNPSDMVVTQDGPSPLLIVANRSGNQAIVTDVDSGERFVLALNSSPVNLLLREGEVAPQLFLYGPGSKWVYQLDIESLMDNQGANLNSVSIADGVTTAVPLDADRLLIQTDTQLGMVILDLATLETFQFSTVMYWDTARSAYWQQKLFIAGAETSSVHSVNTETGAPQSLILDEAVRQFYVFPNKSTGMVMHDNFQGRATVFPLDKLNRSNATVVDGLWLEGLFDREAVVK